MNANKQEWTEQQKSDASEFMIKAIRGYLKIQEALKANISPDEIQANIGDDSFNREIAVSMIDALGHDVEHNFFSWYADWLYPRVMKAN